jgi:hypothetical protein
MPVGVDQDRFWMTLHRTSLRAIPSIGRASTADTTHLHLAGFGDVRAPGDDSAVSSVHLREVEVAAGSEEQERSARSRSYAFQHLNLLPAIARTRRNVRGVQRERTTRRLEVPREDALWPGSSIHSVSPLLHSPAGLTCQVNHAPIPEPLPDRTRSHTRRVRRMQHAFR